MLWGGSCLSSFILKDEERGILGWEEVVVDRLSGKSLLTFICILVQILALLLLLLPLTRLLSLAHCLVRVRPGLCTALCGFVPRWRHLPDHLGHSQLLHLLRTLEQSAALFCLDLPLVLWDRPVVPLVAGLERRPEVAHTCGSAYPSADVTMAPEHCFHVWLEGPCKLERVQVR